MNDRLSPQIKQRSPFSPPTKPDRLFPTSNSDRTLTPTRPDRLFPQNQTAIAPHTHKPDRLFPKPNNDRPTPNQNLIAYFLNIKFQGDAL